METRFCEEHDVIMYLLSTEISKDKGWSYRERQKRNMKQNAEDTVDL